MMQRIVLFIALSLLSFFIIMMPSLIKAAALDKLTDRDYAEAFQVYNDLKIRAGQPIPPLYLIQNSADNAHTNGNLIVLTSGIIRRANGNLDELAMIIGHEMAHAMLQHPIMPKEILSSNDREAQADKMGEWLALRAGYNPCNGRETFVRRMKARPDLANPTDHPNNAFRLEQSTMPWCSKLSSN